MACGAAVIATTAGAFPEFIDDGHTGVLVPPGDAGALASAIKSLLLDPERCYERPGDPGALRGLRQAQLRRPRLRPRVRCSHQQPRDQRTCADAHREQ